MSHGDRMVEDEIPSPQRDVGESECWLNAGDSAESLAHSANLVNDDLRRASGRVEQQVLEFVASMCGKTSLNPASMEFELSAFLATIEEHSSTSDLAEHNLQQAHSFLVCSSMDRACQSLADARSALGQSWEQILQQNRVPSLPGTSESESSFGYLHDRLVEHYAAELQHCVAANQPTGVHNAIEKLSLLLPPERIAATHAAALGQVVEGLLKTWDVSSASSDDDETFIVTVQKLFVDAAGIAAQGFSRCVAQAEWEGVLMQSLAGPVKRFLDATLSKAGTAAVAPLLRCVQSVALASQLASHAVHRELSTAAVTQCLWERSGAAVKAQLRLTVEAGLREEVPHGIQRDSARRNSGGRLSTRSGASGKDTASAAHKTEAGPWVEACTRAVRLWQGLVPLAGEEPVGGFALELASSVRSQVSEYVSAVVLELPGTMEREGGVGGMRVLAGLLVIQRGIQHMAAAGDGSGEVSEEWDRAAAAVVTGVGEVMGGVLGVVGAGWRDAMVSPIALMPWSTNQQMLKRDTARASQGLMLWNLALSGWTRDALLLLPLDVTRHLLSHLLSSSLAALAAVYFVVAPSRINMPQFLLDVDYITQVVDSWQCGVEVQGKLLSLDGAGPDFVTHVCKMCNGLRAMAVLKASPLPVVTSVLRRIDALRSEESRGGDSPTNAPHADAMELGTPAAQRGGGGGARELRKASCLESDGRGERADMLEDAYKIGGRRVVFGSGGSSVERAGLDGLAHMRVLLASSAGEGQGSMLGWGGEGGGEGPGQEVSVSDMVKSRMDLGASTFPPLEEEERAAAAEVVAWCARSGAGEGFT